VVNFTLRLLYPQEKSPWYPLDRRLGVPRSRYGRGEEEKNSQPPPGNEPPNPDRQARTSVAIPTELPRLLGYLVTPFKLYKLHTVEWDEKEDILDKTNTECTMITERNGFRRM
jgi:hypothetical protein